MPKPIVYVESNFILEIALQQEQRKSCNKIVNLSKAGKINLVVPAFSIAEPYETVGRRNIDRKSLADKIGNEMLQLQRTASYINKKDLEKDFANFLIQSTEDEIDRLNDTFKKILKLTEIIPLNKNVIVLSESHKNIFKKHQDSVVYSSVLYHLFKSPKKALKCFLNRNSKDFDNPDIIEKLRKYNCVVKFNFDDGYKFLKNEILR